MLVPEVLEFSIGAFSHVGRDENVHANEFCNALCTHFLHDSRSMILHRPNADAQMCSNLFAQHTFRNESHDLAFAFGEIIQVSLDIFHPLLMLLNFLVLIESTMNPIQKMLVVERLFYEIECPVLNRLHR